MSGIARAEDSPLLPTLMMDFESELRGRRDEVYAYLDAWPGISDFKPDHMREAILSYVQSRGKGLRPALLLLSCGATGGDESEAIPAAAAVEIYQIWTLVHDDIIDRDDLRRGSPTVHAQFRERALSEIGLSPPDAAHYGTSVGILAGDLQQSWAYALLCESARRGVGPAVVLELVQRMANILTPLLMEGEMLDVQFAAGAGDPPSGAQVLSMMAKKTAALLEYAAWAGAKIGTARSGGDPRYADLLGEFAQLCGIAFQLQDDLLGLTGDERLLGKPVGNDLREGKHTYIVSRALEHTSEIERKQIRSVLGNRDAEPSEIRAAVDVLHSSGAMLEAERLAQHYITMAEERLSHLPPSPYKQLLMAWSAYLLNRRY